MNSVKLWLTFNSSHKQLSSFSCKCRKPLKGGKSAAALVRSQCFPCLCLGEMAAVDCECVWKLVFGRFPAELFSDAFLAHELLRFLRLNLATLQLRVPQYTCSFPNLLKVRSRHHTGTVCCTILIYTQLGNLFCAHV